MNSHRSFAIQALPNPLSCYGRALLRKPQFGEQDRVPLLQLTWPNFSFEAAPIASYARLCTQPFDGRTVPLLYPHSYFGPLHLQLLTDPSFPLRILGAIHLRNHVRQYTPLQLARHYEAELRFVQQRRRPQGLELDLYTAIRYQGTLQWESISCFLFRRTFQQHDPESFLQNCFQSLSAAQTVYDFRVSPWAGKQFAWLTKDINPIHMSRSLAKVFGFQRDLCHGMWAIGRSLPYLGGVDSRRPLRHDVWFKGPIYMESEVSVKTTLEPSAAFELYCSGNEKPCVQGLYGNAEAQDGLLGG